jgi:acylphosphatase
MKQLHLKISGQVQMVGFRYSAIRMAQKLNLTGWVRNSEDGGVEILAQGEENNLQELLDWAHSGPSSARVENVEYEWGESGGKYDKFDVKY